MSEQRSQSTTMIAAAKQRRPPDDYPSWPDYWRAQGMPWRTEPEIDEERQQYLAERRAIHPDIAQGIYPFKGIQLSRADMEWLLATHQSDGIRGPVVWNDPKHRTRVGLDLRGANLTGADLRGLPLTRIKGGVSFAEVPEGARDEIPAAAIHLEKANLREAELQGAELRAARLAGADLRGAFLMRANLYNADLRDTQLSRANLAGASLRRVIFSAATNLYAAQLCDAHYGEPLLRDIQWNGADLTLMQWSAVRRLGDERIIHTRRRPRPIDYPNAARASRQVATVLRSQGLTDDADRFAYRAQVLQRVVLRRQGRLPSYLGSWLLDLLAGYGYKPVRAFIAYALVIVAFAAAYYFLGGSSGQPLAWNEALVVSVTAFHGRGFFASAFQAGDVQAAVAALEAFFGLFIEITLIATFTQRFFAR